MDNTVLAKIMITCARAILVQLAPAQLATMPAAAKADGPVTVVTARSRAIAASPAANGNGGPRAAAVVYKTVPNADQKVVKLQNGNNGKVYAAIKAAGRAGISARHIADGGNINPKSVQSSAYQLRKAGLVQSVRVND